MTQSDILTVTLNPAVDVATTVPEVIAGPKLRCSAPRFDPGGGGVNVARAVRKLGGNATALVAIAGAMGDRLLSLLAAEKVPALSVPVSGETRQSFAVTEVGSGAQYRFGVPGDMMTADDADRLLTAIAAHAPSGGYLVISGSVAPGLPVDFQSNIVATVATRGPKVIVDTSSTALDQLIAEPSTPVHLLRFDDAEATQAAGRPLAGVADMISFAKELINNSVADIVVIGVGAEGSIMVTRAQTFLCRPPIVTEHSKIGAGDAFVGAMTLSLARGEPLDTALRWGVAAGSATVSTEGTALCELGTTQARFEDCVTEVV
ncbi:MAG: 1-phosphofructokinase family hexose kinase [Pseudomonadota bacterium]